MSLGCSQQTLLLEGANSLGANLELDFAAIDNNSLGLQVRLPDFLGVALREADIAAELLALAGEFTDVHNGQLYTTNRDTSTLTQLFLRHKLLYY